MIWDNLDINAQQRAIEEERHTIYLDNSYLEESMEYFTDILETMGFYNTNIRYSGFGSQGDGLSFTGEYKNAKRITLEVRKLTNNTEILILTRRLMKLQQSKRYRLLGHLSAHRETVKVSTSFEGWDYWEDNVVGFRSFFPDEFTEIVKGLCRTFYKRLNEDYDEYVSDEGIIKHFQAGEIEFEEDGEQL